LAAPLRSWIKCNIDGFALGSPGLSACGGLFRNSNGDFLEGFSDNLGTASSLFAELMAAILAIEIAYSNRWFNVWLETDSKLVQLAFKSNISVPWKLQNRWQNCIITARKLNLILSYL
jgi:ribonuclease HI